MLVVFEAIFDTKEILSRCILRGGGRSQKLPRPLLDPRDTELIVIFLIVVL